MLESSKNEKICIYYMYQINYPLNCNLWIHLFEVIESDSKVNLQIINLHVNCQKFTVLNSITCHVLNLKGKFELQVHYKIIYKA